MDPNCDPLGGGQIPFTNTNSFFVNKTIFYLQNTFLRICQDTPNPGTRIVTLREEAKSHLPIRIHYRSPLRIPATHPPLHISTTHPRYTSPLRISTARPHHTCISATHPCYTSPLHVPATHPRYTPPATHLPLHISTTHLPLHISRYTSLAKLPLHISCYISPATHFALESNA